MKKFINRNEILTKFKDNMTIMIGGFLANGTPEKLIDIILQSKVKNLTIICNDTGFDNVGIGKLITSDCIKKVMTSHIGTNPVTGLKMIEGIIEVELIPQGSLAEKIRAGGAGLGGILTATGVGTIVQEGKEIIIVDDKEYLLEKPLKADIAIIKGYRCDKKGNICYKGTAMNFNPVMATAAQTVIAEVDEICDNSVFLPDFIHTPSVYVDYIYKEDGDV